MLVFHDRCVYLACDFNQVHANNAADLYKSNKTHDLGRSLLIEWLLSVWMIEWSPKSDACTPDTNRLNVANNQMIDCAQELNPGNAGNVKIAQLQCLLQYQFNFFEKGSLQNDQLEWSIF